MEQALYIECYAGISGDMFVASLLDLGVDKDYLLSNLQTLPLEGYKINISRVKKMALDACDFNVILDVDNHDHDMQYLYEENHEHSHEHKHEHHEHHIHEANHTHHIHRNLNDVTTIINNSQITDNAKSIANKIFQIIAEAEAKAHGTSVEQVHFHEVGAVDSIVDITAAAICIDKLNINKVFCSSLSEGKGFVNCQHGAIPIPVPAVVNIVSANDLKLHFTNTKGELITPTGAAIIAAIKTDDSMPENFMIEKIGIGAGKRQYNIPNVVRSMLIKY
ncbi:LarC family nickel insertion protein [Megamonas hypermegale]|uniref:LarC family nickel insertion protein n=1 Tax=Megamonas hypermegale TaxID=158847 RepID=UPI001958C1C8|nr:LarC family nickel insertion protein [Megamonas hypermegale]MBM6832853.1 LarC family nickel insertion protein [Megamonas hypermegale]